MGKRRPIETAFIGRNQNLDATSKSQQITGRPLDNFFLPKQPWNLQLPLVVIGCEQNLSLDIYVLQILADEGISHFVHVPDSLRVMNLYTNTERSFLLL